MLHRLSPGTARRITLGADKGYDVASFVGDLRQMAVTPHIAKNDTVTKTGKRRRSAIDARTARHPGYAASQRVRRVDCRFCALVALSVAAHVACDWQGPYPTLRANLREGHG